MSTKKIDKNRWFVCPCGTRSNYRKNVLQHQREKCHNHPESIQEVHGDLGKSYNTTVRGVANKPGYKKFMEESGLEIEKGSVADLTNQYEGMERLTPYSQERKEFADKTINMSYEELRDWQIELMSLSEKLYERKFAIDVKSREMSAFNITNNKAVRIQALINATEELKTIHEHKYRALDIKDYVVPVGMLEIILADVHYSGPRDDERLVKFFEKVLAKVKKDYKKGQKVRATFLGDDIEGELHLSSLDKHNEENTVNQVIGVTDHYINFLIALTEIVPKEMIELVFVCESNHGQIRLHGMDRNMAPKNDVGYLIRYFVTKVIPKEIKVWDTRLDGVVNTPEAWYMHGDKGFMKTAEKAELVLRRTEQREMFKALSREQEMAKTKKEYESVMLDAEEMFKYGSSSKDIIMGHWHTFKATRHGQGRYLITAPKVTNAVELYTVNAGYEETEAAFVILYRVHGKIDSFAVVEVE